MQTPTRTHAETARGVLEYMCVDLQLYSWLSFAVALLAYVFGLGVADVP